ncbi:MAG: hypothetical protein KUG77_10800 [Nannocystaceae bacterium]|nr:hypothetical protein [Nannocystaceae bacterium]
MLLLSLRLVPERPDRGLNLRRLSDDVVGVMAALEKVVGCSAATLAGPDGRLLCLGLKPVAVVADLNSMGALTARVGAATSLPALLGMLTSVRPTGVLLLGSPDGDHSLAVELDAGRAVGAVGSQPLQSMGAWVVELHRRYEETRGSESSSDDASAVRALRPGRTFLQETVLEALTLYDEPGGSLLLLEGEVQWLHERLEPEDTQDIGFVLMELARREDEGAELESRLGTVSAVATPVSKPPEDRAAAPKMRIVGPDLDFVDHPDPAANAEWLDARYVFAFCDGVTDVAGIVERTLLGRFRTLSALSALLQHGHVRLVSGAAESNEHTSESSDELADLIAALS